MKKEHDGAAPRLSGTESDAKHSSSASGQGSPVKVDGAECSAHSEDSSAPQDPGRAMLEQVLGAVQALGDRLEAVETALQLNPGGAAVTGREGAVPRLLHQESVGPLPIIKPRTISGGMSGKGDDSSPIGTGRARMKTALPGELGRRTDEEKMRRTDKIKGERTADKDMERLLELLQRRAKEARLLEEAQREWEARNPISAALILTPGTVRSSMWQWLIIFTTLLSIAFAPIDIAFSLSSTDEGIKILLLLFDCLFMVDMVFEFRTSFFDDKLDVLVKNPALICQRYLQNGFAIDLVGTIPFEIILVSSDLGEQWALHALKFINLLRISKMFRLASTEPRITRARERMGTAGQQVVALTAWLVWFFHVLGCIYWVIVRAEFESFAGEDLARELSENDWLPPHSLVNITNEGTPHPNAEPKLTFSAYCFCFWWAMSVVIGAQVPIPRHTAETTFTTVASFIGFLSYAWVIGSFTAALSQLSVAADAENEKRNYVKQYLHRAQVPTILRTKIDSYYGESVSLKDERVADLPRTLQSQVELVMNRALFISVPFLRNCHVDEIKALTPIIEHEHEWPGSTVVHQNYPSAGIYLILRGFVKSLDPRGVLCGIMCEPESFGATCFSTPSAISVITVTTCQFLLLPSERFEFVLNQSSTRTRDAFRRYVAVESNTSTNDLATQQAQVRNARANALKQRWRLSPHRGEIEGLIVDLEHDIAKRKPPSSMRSSLPIMRSNMNGTIRKLSAVIAKRPSAAPNASARSSAVKAALMSRSTSTPTIAGDAASAPAPDIRESVAFFAQ